METYGPHEAEVVAAGISLLVFALVMLGFLALNIVIWWKIFA